MRRDVEEQRRKMAKGAKRSWDAIVGTITNALDPLLRPATATAQQVYDTLKAVNNGNMNRTLHLALPSTGFAHAGLVMGDEVTEATLMSLTSLRAAAYPEG